MALDDLPGTLEVPTRDAIATAFRRDYGIVSPESDTSDGTQPDVLAKTVSTTILPVYSNAVLIANAINEDAATGKRLDRVGARYGVTRPQAIGASGYVYVSAADSGGTITAGDEIKNRQTQKRYEAAETKTLFAGGTIRISGLDTGPATNLDAGTTLQWSAPRPGIGQTATVATGGLIGGADVADDAKYLALIQEARQNPPNADNDAAIQKAVRATPGIAIASVFSFPCVFGPGTYAFAFLIATAPGSSPDLRVPNAAQRTAVLAWTLGQIPSADSYFCLQVVKEPVTVAFRVTWDPGAFGWIDAVPWPAYALPGAIGVAGAAVVTAATSSTAFTLGTDNANYVTAVTPQVGQSIAFWDAAKLLFRKKRIASVTGSGPWPITTESNDQTNGSDTLYTPQAGDRAMPWSDSLADLVKPMLAYFNNLGPGELFSVFSNDGRRQRRNPVPPKKYPQVVDTDAIVPVLGLSSVRSALLVEGTGPVSVGIPGVTVNLRTLGQIAVFAR